MLGSETDLQMHAKDLGVHFPKTEELKLLILWRFSSRQTMPDDEK